MTRKKSFFSFRKVLVVVSVAAIGVAAWYPFQSEENDATRYSVVLLEPETEFYEFTLDDPLIEPEADPLQVEIEELAPEQPVWYEYVIASGDNLGKIFKNEGLPINAMYNMLQAKDANDYLKKLRPGQRVRYQLDDDSQLQVMEIALSSMEQLHFERGEGNNYSLKVMEEPIEYKPVKLAGEINGSFYLSAVKANLTPAMIQQFANIFEWQVDFSRDLRAGDRFEILQEQAKLNDGSIRNGNILVARLYRGKREITGIRYDDGRYYSPEGKGMGRALLRYPVDKKFRISSSFNRKRRHPVTGRVRPHYGTDWATPTGTKVQAPGDGVVIRAVRNHPAAGNFIEVRHGRRYVTRYLHLSRISVKKGQQVKQGQVIARTGNTGLSTGPHLHYELHVSGRPVNSMKVKLPASEGVPENKLESFRKSSGHLLAKLDGKLDGKLGGSVDGTIVAATSTESEQESENVL